MALNVHSRIHPSVLSAEVVEQYNHYSEQDLRVGHLKIYFIILQSGRNK